MPKLVVTDRSGETRVVHRTAGLSVMEVIRDSGFGELLALCGGCCSCATCHVLVSPEWQDKLPPLGAGEDDLLDSSAHRTKLSRLSCQLPFTGELDGLAVTIAAED